ncbi:MAG: T9SS type A sorting domain-containing protein [Bacteroidia bacterium]
MKRLLPVILFLSLTIIGAAQKTAWTYYEDTTGTFSSPRAADLNSDGVLDVVMGAGSEDKARVSTIAVNGATGQLLWKTVSQNEIFGSAVFFDANGDKSSDVLMCGRTGILECRNGKDGKLIWEFFDRDKKEAADSGWHNFFQPQVIPDQNKDGVQDILVSNGGDKSKSYQDTIGRPAGLIMVLNGKNGRIIESIKTPDKQETYMAPLVHDFNKDGKLQVIFGSGGETMTGALWAIDLKDLVNKRPQNAIRIAFTSKKGFIAPPSIGDINLDGFDDIIVNAYNGDIMAYSGKDFSKLWQVDLQGFETQCSPAIGNFYGSHHPDVLAVVFKGKAPNFTDYKQILIDGKNGKVVWEDSLSDLQFASPAAADFNQDGYDEALFSYNKMNNGSFVHDLDIFNFQTMRSTSLISNEKGINLSSTPLILDLDGDDSLEIVYSIKKNDKNPIAADGLTIKVLRSISKKPSWGVAWGGYLGSNGDALYEFTSSECSRFMLDVFTRKTKPSCNNYNDGKIELSLISGMKKVVYTWSDNGTGAIRDKMRSGKYLVRYMDQQGCYQIDTVKLNDPYEISISADSTFCPNEESGAAYISSSGCKCASSGCKFKWNTGGTDHSIYNLAPGIYTVELTHTDGCKVFDTVEVFRSHPILDTMWKHNVSCFGNNDGEIFLDPFDTADFRAKWLHNSERAWYLDSLKPDTYSVELRDYRWCFDTLNIIINEPKPFEFSVKDYQHIDCNGSSTGLIELGAKGGWKNYTFYQDSFGFADSTLYNLAAGDYTVFAKDSANCVSDSQTVTLFERPKIELEFGSLPQTDPFDDNGTAWVIATGGLAPFKYKWDNDEKTDTIFNLKANKYQVVVTDALGCTESGEVEVDFSTSTFSIKSSQLFSAFPNPTSGTLMVKASPGSELIFSTYDGKEIEHIESTGLITNLDCNQLPKGIYLLQCLNGADLQIVKVVVE